VSPFLLGFTLVVAGLIGLGLRRVHAGPTVFDRLVAVALVTVNGVVVLVLLGFLFDRPVFFLDIALAYALLAFVLPIAVSRYFEQRDRHARPSPATPPPEPGREPGAADEAGRETGAADEAARGPRPPADEEGER
jgi:multicomponent Na+:H+ antiporter subunit F